MIIVVISGFFVAFEKVDKKKLKAWESFQTINKNDVKARNLSFPFLQYQNDYHKFVAFIDDEIIVFYDVIGMANLKKSFIRDSNHEAIDIRILNLEFNLHELYVRETRKEIDSLLAAKTLYHEKFYLSKFNMKSVHKERINICKTLRKEKNKDSLLTVLENEIEKKLILLNDYKNCYLMKKYDAYYTKQRAKFFFDCVDKLLKDENIDTLLHKK